MVRFFKKEVEGSAVIGELSLPFLSKNTKPAYMRESTGDRGDESQVESCNRHNRKYLLAGPYAHRCTYIKHLSSPFPCMAWCTCCFSEDQDLSTSLLS